MATKQIMIRTVGLLFLPALFMTVLGTLQEIPDDKVYTEIQKTFINGSWGILTCRFSGPAYAVYWQKGHDPWTAPTLMTWTPDGKTGPRYEDGACDMDENYSLIIKAVSYTDEGRYICLVSNQHGVLIDNYTDVTVTDIAVKTEPTVAMQMGQTGVLPCQVNIRPKKVLWMKSSNQTLITTDLSRNVIERNGPGYEEGLFNITKEYSLVINDVTIFHEGRYICEVIDFDTNNMYRDVTILTVFAQPTEPFPTIKECPVEDQANCIITTDSSVTLTCHVNEYYPLINLFFVHGSERLEPQTIKTWNNTDGTKNKSITISAVISDDLYKCVASKIPGLDLNDEISAAVRLVEGQQRNSLIFTVILVPVVICLTVILLTWMRLRKRGRRLSVSTDEIYMEGFIEDHISFVELWKLVENIIGNLEEHKLSNLTVLLDGNEHFRMNESYTNIDQDYYYYYKKLCAWKETCDQTINQRNVLSEKCSQAGLTEFFLKVDDFRKPTSDEVPSCDLEHILWQINDPQKIIVFLSTLGVDMPGEMRSLRKKRFMQEAMDRLVSWSKGHFPFRAVVILSSVLEKLGHCRGDDDFFQIPAQKKQSIDNHELKSFVTKTWSKKLLHKFFEPIEPGLEIMLSTALEENDEVLFNTQKMLRDWWENAECSNYDRRLILHQVCNENSNNIKYPESIDHHLSDEELKMIAGYLSPKSMVSVCDKLCITSLLEDGDEKQRFDVLCRWRTSMNDRKWTSVYGQLKSALEEVGILGILPPLRSDPVHRAEYVDIAFDLRMMDVLPIAKALGINVNKLPAYRPVFKPSHLKRGTIGLIARLVESLNKDDSRRIMCSRLRESGFSTVAHRMMVYPVRYGELYAISDAMIYAMMEDNCTQRAKGTRDDEEKLPGEGEKLLSGNDSTPNYVETFAEKRPREEMWSERHLRHLKKMLILRDEEVDAHPLLQTERLDEFALFKVWKEKPYPPVFNERAAIIQGLIDIDRPEIARSVAEGKYYSTEVSLRFINHIVTRMDEHELRRFMEICGIQEFEKALGVDNVSQIIHDFTRNTKVTYNWLSRKISDGPLDLSDKIVDNGFLDIARELIFIHK